MTTPTGDWVFDVMGWIIYARCNSPDWLCTTVSSGKSSTPVTVTRTVLTAL
ncbi:hypothetical protein [Stenomitos frigidus]|uniref:hypothetical protein n=1 Tax=Stenomitos frigidus TaxID=1886765 RepID=UPI0015E6C870|nr:hypothetical protein [Stenomitos frigidus]